jgi:hypothetical protein
LRSKTDHKLHVEEANQFNNYWRFFKLFDLYSISFLLNFWRNSKKSISKINERKQANEVLGCDEQAFEYHSNVDAPYLSTDTEVKSKQLKARQNQGIESTNFSVDFITSSRSKLILLSMLKNGKSLQLMILQSIFLPTVTEVLKMFHTFTTQMVHGPIKFFI